MLKKEFIKKLFCALMATVYLFVVLFSQKFHNHGSGKEFQGFHFVKKENTITKAKFSVENIDCLACHIASDGHAVFPEVFNQKISFVSEFSVPKPEIQSLYLYKRSELSTQRGPPAYSL